MLIRIVSHPVNNSDHVDKMIYIEGLPETLIYRVKDGKKFLKDPWRVDADVNIPDSIKHVFFRNPVEVWFELPRDPQFQGTQDTEYSVKANAFVLDYQSAQGERMWDQIEKILDRETPRDMPVPEPAVVGDRKSWHLEAAEVPSVVLTKGEVNLPKPVSVPVVKVEKPVVPDEVWPCAECGKQFPKKRGLMMHEMAAHKRKKRELAKAIVQEAAPAVAS